MSNTRVMTLTDFLLARIAEDEEMARNALALGGDYYDEKPVKWHWISTNGESTSWQPSPVDPARVLAECEAKRRIVEDFEALHADYQASHSSQTEARRLQALIAMSHLAAAYADHPDYDPAWRP